MPEDPGFNPDKQLFVDDILDRPKSREAHGQDSYEERAQANKTVLEELEALGVVDAAKLKERMAEFATADGELDSPLSRIAVQYFSESKPPSAGETWDEPYRLGCLAEVTQWLAEVYLSPSDDFVIDHADSTIMQHVGPIEMKTHNVLLEYLGRLTGSW